MSTVTLNSVVKQFNDVVAVNNISYEIADGEFFVIVGPSGCGKSTTLRMIAGFETPTTGEISIDDSDVTHLKPDQRDTRMVFQSYALFPHMTVDENIRFGLKMNDVDPATHDKRVKDALELIGLSAVGHKYPEELSGGQQQRVALARALVLEPDVLLLDEPLSNLDKNLRDQMQIELKRIQTEIGVTAIHVTHNQEEALSLADRVCVMNDGVVEQIGKPEEVYYRPQNEFVASFLGDSNVFEASPSPGDGHALSLEDSSVSIAVSESNRSEESSTAFFRPENVEVGEPARSNGHQNSFDGTVRNGLFSGDKVTYEIEIGDSDQGGTITVLAFDTGSWEIDDDVHLRIPPEVIHML